jgi:hypothetical protein
MKFKINYFEIKISFKSLIPPKNVFFFDIFDGFFKIQKAFKLKFFYFKFKLSKNSLICLNELMLTYRSACSQHKVIH